MSIQIIAQLLAVVLWPVIALSQHRIRPLPSFQAHAWHDTRESQGGQLEQAMYKGLYVDEKYGFSIIIPDNFVGKGSVPPAPNHGFKISFSPDMNDWIGVFAEYAVADDSSTAGHNTSRSSRERRVTIRAEALGGLPAHLRTTITAPRGKQSSAIVEEVLWARRQSGGEKIDYTLILTTRQALLPEREKIFQGMIASFELLPVR